MNKQRKREEIAYCGFNAGMCRNLKPVHGHFEVVGERGQRVRVDADIIQAALDAQYRRYEDKITELNGTI